MKTLAALTLSCAPAVALAHLGGAHVHAVDLGGLIALVVAIAVLIYSTGGRP